MPVVDVSTLRTGLGRPDAKFPAPPPQATATELGRITIAVALLVITTSSACNGPAVAHCEQRARAACEIAFSCCEDTSVRNTMLASLSFGGVAASTPLSTSKDECVERAAASCKTELGAVDDAIELGRIEFDDVAARTCTDALAAAAEGCDAAAAQWWQHTRCDDVIDGLVAGGDACAQDSECRGGGACDLGGGEPFVDDDLRAPAGECVELPAQGQECPEGACAEGLFCQDNRCEVLPREGDSCNFECAPGLVCDGVDSTCAPLRVDGEVCRTSDECFSGSCAGTCSGVSEGVCS